MTAPNANKASLAGALLFPPMVALAQPPAPIGLSEETMFGLVALLPIATMVFLAVVAAIALFFASQREKRRNELIARFADKGHDVPVSLLPLPPSRRRELRRATWLLGWGGGIGLVLYITTGDWNVAAWCLILLFLSAAGFVNAVLFYPSSGSDQ